MSAEYIKKVNDKPLAASEVAPASTLKTIIDGKEDTSNKVTAWGSTPSDTKYPSEKLVKTALDGKSDKSSTVSNVAWSSSKLTKTINGTTTDVVSASTLKSAMSLNNVTNDAQVKRSEMGTASGVATLDANGIINTSQLPSYVDDVLEYSAKSQFPATGETGKIYVDTSTNLTWRWSGTTYVEISPSLALGETSSTAYRGDRGKTAYDHSQLTSGNPHNVTAADVKAVRYDTNAQGLTDTQKGNARTNIGAGTSNLALGTSSTTAAKGDHTHTTSIASDSSSGTVVTLAHNTQYKLTAGGTSVLFKTPTDSNTDTKVTQTKDDSGTTAYPLLMAGATDPNGSATTARYDSGVKLTPSTNTISANISGNAATATSATTATDYNTSSGTIKTALDSKVDFGLSNNTSNIGNDAPAADCISYWGSDNIPNNHIKMVYNQPGAEATLIFSKRSTYGSILKYGYIDKYVYVLRNQNGTWKSNDWEKISAGYADSAGTATTAQNYDTNTGTIKTALEGKMNTSGDNAVAPSEGGTGATATLLNNLSSTGLDDISSDNVCIPTTNSDGSNTNKWYKRPLSKLWPWIISHTQVKLLKAASESWLGVGTDESHYIELNYDGTASSPTMGIWTRWASGSGNAKYMCKCDSDGVLHFGADSSSGYSGVAGDSSVKNFFNGAELCGNSYRNSGTSHYRFYFGKMTPGTDNGAKNFCGLLEVNTIATTSGAVRGTGFVAIIKIDARNYNEFFVNMSIINNNGWNLTGLRPTLIVTEDGDLRKFSIGFTNASGTLQAFQYTRFNVTGIGYSVGFTYDRWFSTTSSKSSSDYFWPATLGDAENAESARELRIPYGSGSIYLQIGVSGTYLSLGTNMADGVMVSYAGEASQAAVADRLGTTSVGSDSNPIYLNNGVPTACNWWVS